MKFAKLFNSLKWLKVIFAAGALTGTFIGIIGGLSVGVIIGMLTAPKEGKQTRKDISKKAENLLAALQTRGEGLTQSISETISKKSGEAA